MFKGALRFLFDGFCPTVELRLNGFLLDAKPCQISHASDPMLLEQIEHPGLDAGFLRELVDDRRLEADLRLEERIRLPIERFERDKPRALEPAIRIEHPSGGVEFPDERRVE